MYFQSCDKDGSHHLICHLQKRHAACRDHKSYRMSTPWHLLLPFVRVISDEVSHVKSWAASQNLQLNCAKSQEIVFWSRRLRSKSEQLNELIYSTDHVSSILALCSSLLCV